MNTLQRLSAILLLSLVLPACQTDTEKPASGMPEEIASVLQEIGPVIEVARTSTLYTPFFDQSDFNNKNVARNISYGTHERHVLDIFASTETGSPKPVVVFVHGGGFSRGAKSSPDSPFYDNIMNWAVDNGMVGVNINYRLAPEFPWPSGIEDMGRVVSWLQTNIGEYGGDPDNIYLWGHSAGGAHVTDYLAWMASKKQNDYVAGAILTSPVILHGESTIWTAYYGEEASLYAQRSPLSDIAKTETPLFINGAELDAENFQEDVKNLLEALDSSDKQYTHLHLPGHSHISETYAVGSGDETLSGPVKAFIMQVSGM